MALKVEVVVDGGMHAGEALVLHVRKCWSRFRGSRYLAEVKDARGTSTIGHVARFVL
jgi:hypothetical protein